MPCNYAPLAFPLLPRVAFFTCVREYKRARERERLLLLRRSCIKLISTVGTQGGPLRIQLSAPIAATCDCGVRVCAHYCIGNIFFAHKTSLTHDEGVKNAAGCGPQGRVRPLNLRVTKNVAQSVDSFSAGDKNLFSSPSSISILIIYY